MNDDMPDSAFEQKLHAALGSIEKADFDAWRARHADAVAFLNPVVTELQQRKRRLFMRMVTAAVATATCVFVIWFFIPEKVSFAQAVKRIDNAKTMTWTMTSYERCRSRDGKRTWLETSRKALAYRSPGLFRLTGFDDAGNVSFVETVDGASGKHLGLDMKQKRTYWQHRAAVPVGDYSHVGPFDWVANALKKQALEFVGTRKVNDRTVNVFRWQSDPGNKVKSRSHDIWIDPVSKECVGWSSPGADEFDPATMPDRNNPAEKGGSCTILGTIVDGIVYDAKLDPEQFSLTPPPGFEIVTEPHPTVTEAELVKWLEAMARVNNGSFPAALKNHAGFEPTRWSEIARKKRQDRTEAEQSMYNLFVKYAQSGDNGPVDRFVKEHAAAGSFRYVGVGVKLGSADRIVCWYKSKSTGTYRAVFGDLTVKDVSPKDLPLPVDR
ncbi:MAG TPA: hypothetical protein VG055_10220 [Planctomycetaceae bacterium]|jgi:hypothetical protein|nr:hypothetical protein [Planctomycetaceae bacterium]